MNSILRVIDANLNRSREGLRVCEDLTRFIMSHSFFSKELKKLRHELNAAGMSLPFESKYLLIARNSARDVGKNRSIRDEKKISWKSIMKANFKRVEESLRVLEECSKIVAPKNSHLFQKIRFEVYELEKEVIRKL